MKILLGDNFLNLRRPFSLEVELETKTEAIAGTDSKNLGQTLDTSSTTSADANDLITVLVSVQRIA